MRHAIRSAIGKATFYVDAGYPSGNVQVGIVMPLSPDGVYSPGDRFMTVTRTDFLAAVEAECGVRIVPTDAIVIERAELPEVVKQAGTVEGVDGLPASCFDAGGVSGYSDDLPAIHRGIARGHLALAEYLDARPPTPPVDEADVEALTGIIAQVRHGDDCTASDLAQRLIAAGRVSVTS